MTIQELAEKCKERRKARPYPCSFCPYIRECEKCRKELPFICTHEISKVIEKLSLEL